jgi:hypothetical protein
MNKRRLLRFLIPKTIVWIVFFLFHIPLFFIAQYGLLLIRDGLLTGIISALFLGIAGMAFLIHEYNQKTSNHRKIIVPTAVISFIQIVLSVHLFIKLTC